MSEHYLSLRDFNIFGMHADFMSAAWVITISQERSFESKL